MISIIYYQEITVIGAISILLSLLSVLTKSLIFSTSTIMSGFFLTVTTKSTVIFNWISKVTDFFGIFCSVLFVFYNYNGNANENGIITQWGYIWIYQSVGIWSLICICLFFAIVPLFFWHIARRSNHSIGKELCKAAVQVFLVSILSAIILFVFINVSLFTIIAYVKFIQFELHNSKSGRSEALQLSQIYVA